MIYVKSITNFLEDKDAFSNFISNFASENRAKELAHYI